MIDARPVSQWVWGLAWLRFPSANMMLPGEFRVHFCQPEHPLTKVHGVRDLFQHADVPVHRLKHVLAPLITRVCDCLISQYKLIADLCLVLAGLIFLSENRERYSWPPGMWTALTVRSSGLIILACHHQRCLCQRRPRAARRLLQHGDNRASQ